MVRNNDFEGSNNSAQSITQHCQSYIFQLKYNDEIKLRIIDTPSFDDTQNKINMQHILEYINNFSYLNAICFLIKSNTEQMNIFFRLCLTQLVDFLGPNTRKNLILCFTHTQVHETILNSFSMNDILFREDNTFCFDSESCQYLVALQNGIQFNDREKQKYEKSWSISVMESNRLINYIHKTIICCLMPGKLQSIKHAQFEIIPTIRPMLETMHNILRNIIIQNMDSTAKSIEIHSNVIHRPATICLMCKPEIHQVGNFLIVNDFPHEIQEVCYTCSCPFNQHIPIGYMLKYELSNHSLKIDLYQVKDLLLKLCYASAEFALSYVCSMFKCFILKIINKSIDKG
ncbi:unnamed protein product [Rotaria sp. Silwood2]|nr:unnamed protein product [Rotaria sp. Silwood2]